MDVVSQLDHLFEGHCIEVHMGDSSLDIGGQLEPPEAINKFVTAATVKFMVTQVAD